MSNRSDYLKITTLINRAILLAEGKEEAAVLRYMLEQTRAEATTLAHPTTAPSGHRQIH
ncbi:hypothetical protein [uncultured Cohaesibacter sp.]|uniref:hypothetical protein n=1 Tax=uncultured Cohaesibacter sp. TaxID=1002546 RepID=UPI0029C9259F|nr:hypothetical protein [uncultured Cohaesibacter sp.]